MKDKDDWRCCECYRIRRGPGYPVCRSCRKKARTPAPNADRKEKRAP